MEVSIDKVTKKIKLGPSFDYHLGRRSLDCLKQNADKIHQIEVISGATETHGSVRKRSISLALALKKCGLQFGDVVLICGINHNNVCIPTFASLFIGTIPINLAVGMTSSELEHVIGLSKPSIVFSDPEMIEPIKTALIKLNIGIEIIAFAEKYYNNVTLAEFAPETGDEDNFKCEDFDPSTTTAIAVCSSGTTGLPKLVAISHKTMSIILASPFVSNENVNFEENSDSCLHFSPMFWISGISTALMSCLYGTVRLQSTKGFSPEIAKRAIEAYKPSTILLSPIVLYYFSKYLEINRVYFPSLKSVLTGGSSLNYDIVKNLESKLPNGIVIVAYGSTEAGNISANPGYVRGSVGKINPWVQWKVVNTHTSETLGPNLPGELRLKTQTIFEEYYNDITSTQSAFDEDGFYKTGDLVYYDKDDYVYIVDRVKDVIKYRNYQIATAELENVIAGLPEVLSVAVVGVRSEYDGEHPMAFVQLKNNATLKAQEIKDVIKSCLSDYKQLRGGVVFMDQLPLTHSGKINKGELNFLKLKVEPE